MTILSLVHNLSTSLVFIIMDHFEFAIVLQFSSITWFLLESMFASSHIHWTISGQDLSHVAKSMTHGFFKTQWSIIPLKCMIDYMSIQNWGTPEKFPCDTYWNGLFLFQAVRLIITIRWYLRWRHTKGMTFPRGTIINAITSVLASTNLYLCSVAYILLECRVFGNSFQTDIASSIVFASIWLHMTRSYHARFYRLMHVHAHKHPHLGHCLHHMNKYPMPLDSMTEPFYEYGFVLAPFGITPNCAHIHVIRALYYGILGACDHDGTQIGNYHIQHHIYGDIHFSSPAIDAKYESK